MFYILRSNACGSWKNQSLWFELARSRSVFGVIWWDRYQMKAVFLYFFVLQTVLVVFTTKQHIFYKMWPTLLSQNNKIKVDPSLVTKDLKYIIFSSDFSYRKIENYPKVQLGSFLTLLKPTLTDFGVDRPSNAICGAWKHPWSRCLVAILKVGDRYCGLCCGFNTAFVWDGSQLPCGGGGASPLHKEYGASRF